MAELHVDVLLAAFALELGFAALGAGSFFALGFEPGGECVGGLEVVLEFADYVGGGDALGFVDGFFAQLSLLLYVVLGLVVTYQRRPRRSFRQTWFCERVGSLEGIP